MIRWKIWLLKKKVMPGDVVVKRYDIVQQIFLPHSVLIQWVGGREVTVQVVRYFSSHDDLAQGFGESSSQNVEAGMSGL